jgi:hypothetical protein
MRRYRTRLAGLGVLFIAPGCLTVGMDNEFVETVEAYRADGSVESVTETRWTQNARGGPFTDVERLKQDTAYRYTGPDGESYDIGQGSGAEGVSGQGQSDALMTALQALSAVVGSLVPPPAAP